MKDNKSKEQVSLIAQKIEIAKPKSLFTLMTESPTIAQNKFYISLFLFLHPIVHHHHCSIIYLLVSTVNDFD